MEEIILSIMKVMASSRTYVFKTAKLRETAGNVVDYVLKRKIPHMTPHKIEDMPGEVVLLVPRDSPLFIVDRIKTVLKSDVVPDDMKIPIVYAMIEEEGHKLYMREYGFDGSFMAMIFDVMATENNLIDHRVSDIPSDYFRDIIMTIESVRKIPLVIVMSRNESLGKTFYDFIYGERAEDVKELLASMKVYDALKIVRESSCWV